MKKDSGLVICAISSYWNVFRMIFVIFFLFLLGDAFYRWDGFRYYASFSEFIPGIALMSIIWIMLAALTSIIMWLPLKSFEWFYQRIKRKIILEYLLLFLCGYGLLKVANWVNTNLIILYKAKLLIKNTVSFTFDKYYASFSEFVPDIILTSIFWIAITILVSLLVWLSLRIIEIISHRMGWEINKKGLLILLSFFMGSIAAIVIFKKFIMVYARQEFLIKEIVIFILALCLTWQLGKKGGQRKFLDKLRMVPELITPLVWIFGIWVMLSVPIVTYQTLWKHTDNSLSQKPVQSAEAGKNKPNIILVTFDTMTARDMSVYGYHRPTTPFINKWAKTASLFTRAQADSNFTTATAASLMTGKRVWTHQILQTDASMPVKSKIESLPLLLKNNGYYNMAFIQNTLASVTRLGISNSFDIAPSLSEFITPRSWYGIIDKSLYQLFGKKIQLYDWILKKDFILWKSLKIFYRTHPEFSVTETPAEKVFNNFLTTIDNNPPEPFFSWIHVYPPHDPYLPPAPYMGMFNSSTKMRTHRTVLYIQWHDDKNKIDIMRARYDEFIRYCDKQFEDLIEQLAKRNKLKNSIIILSSDHGESFEHNYFTHGGAHLYEQVTHIPLIVKESNQTEGKVINEVVEQIDIPATILDLANIPVPSWMEGRSLVPLLHGKKLPSRSVFSMSFWLNQGRGHQLTKGTIAAWEDNYKLIHYLDEKKSLLFNLKQDPDEMNNLFDKEPETGQHLLSLIQDNLEKANKKIRTERTSHVTSD